MELDPTFAVAYLHLAWAYGELENLKARNGAYEKAKTFSAKATDKERLYIEAAYARAIERDPEKRFRILKQIAKKYSKEKRIHYDLGFYYEGKNMFDQAIEVCKEAPSFVTPPGMHIQMFLRFNLPFIKDVLARAYLKNGEIDKAIVEYERIITFDPKSQELFLIHPKYHYRLAKLYEQKGWKGKAIEHYEKLLDLWKDAGPGIAEVEDAKKRLAALRS